jgi:hypothetical protein
MEVGGRLIIDCDGSAGGSCTHVLEHLDLARDEARRIVREEATRIAAFASELEASPMLAGDALEAALVRVGWHGAIPAEEAAARSRGRDAIRQVEHERAARQRTDSRHAADLIATTRN